MTTLLIVESNTPAMVAEGHAGAFGFVRSFASFAPEVRLRLTAPYAAAFQPEELRGVDGVIFSGSGVPWGVTSAEAKPLRDAMEVVFAEGLPVWGSCNGMQLGAVVLGGTVGDCPNGIEIGTARNIELTSPGTAHPMLSGRASGYAVPCIHFHEVQSLGSDTVLLAGNDHTPIQAITCASGPVDFWGTQYHPELRLADIAAYVRGGTFGNADALLTHLEAGDADPDAAAALGTSLPELGARTLELQNWLSHVRATRAALS